MLLPPLGQCGNWECRFVSKLKAPNFQDLGNRYILRVISLFFRNLEFNQSQSIIYFPKTLIYSVRVRERESLGKKRQQTLAILPC